MTTDEAIDTIAKELARISPLYKSVAQARRVVAQARRTIEHDPAKFVAIVLADFAQHSTRTTVEASTEPGTKTTY